MVWTLLPSLRLSRTDTRPGVIYMNAEIVEGIPEEAFPTASLFISLAKLGQTQRG